jgi:2-(1,2-epoxy-1,2-dihydrophenyl)acetyl-CoA isomerase
MPEPINDPSIKYRAERGVASIELNRPTANNALDLEMKQALLAALDAAKADTAVRAVAVTATGKNFCVGQDLAEHVEALRSDPQRALDTVRDHYAPIIRRLNDIEVPIVVGINGACVGAGLGIAMAGDIRIAGQSVKFGTAFTGIGLASDSGLSATLTAALGPSRAAALFLLGETFNAEQADAWGLAHEVVPNATVGDHTAAMAARLAAGPTAAFTAVKRLIAMSTKTSDESGARRHLDLVLDSEASFQQHLGASRDHAAAVEAFLNRQKPTFLGH